MLTTPITSIPLSTAEERVEAAWLSELLTTKDITVAMNERDRIGAYDPDVVVLSWFHKNARMYQVRGNRL